MRRIVVAVLVLGSTLGLTGCRRAPSRGRVLALGLAVFSKDAAGLTAVPAAVVPPAAWE
jgi:hypothetical protein